MGVEITFPDTNRCKTKLTDFEFYECLAKGSKKCAYILKSSIGQFCFHENRSDFSIDDVGHF